MEQADALMAAKSLSISKLMVLAPPGTVDPMPHLYDTSMYAYAGKTTIFTSQHVLPIHSNPNLCVSIPVKLV